MDSTLPALDGLTGTLIGLLMDSRSECPKRRNLRSSISFRRGTGPLVTPSSQERILSPIRVTHLILLRITKSCLSTFQLSKQAEVWLGIGRVVPHLPFIFPGHRASQTIRVCRYYVENLKVIRIDRSFEFAQILSCVRYQLLRGTII
jgi:hypothetical protein